jgi:hypothetical protein
MTSETVRFASVVESTAGSAEALYFTLNGIPNLPDPFPELHTQIQAMRTVLRLLAGIPDTVALDPKVIDLIENFGGSCVSIRESVERFSQSDDPDWTAFQDGMEDTATIVRKLSSYLASIVIGGLRDLKSVLRHPYLTRPCANVGTVLTVILPFQLKVGKNTRNSLQMLVSLTLSTVKI